MLLEVEKLEVAYGDYQVVWGVSLGVAAGESVALLGPNGSGKSTVVNTITGLLAAKAGDIRFEGASLVGRPMHHARAARYRACAGAPARVPAPERAAEPHAGRLASGRQGRARASRPSGSSRCFLACWSARASLHARCRAASSRCWRSAADLMSLPRLLMVDEPFLGLAPQVMEQMKAVFEKLKSEGMAILFIEQNVRLALSMSSRGYILESGRLACRAVRGAGRQPRGAADLPPVDLQPQQTTFSATSPWRSPSSARRSSEREHVYGRGEAEIRRRPCARAARRGRGSADRGQWADTVIMRLNFSPWGMHAPYFSAAGRRDTTRRRASSLSCARRPRVRWASCWWAPGASSSGSPMPTR